MRILVLTPTFLPAVGGAELVLWEVFRRLSSRHQVLLLTPELSSGLITQYAKNREDYPIPFEVRRFRDRFSFMRLRGHGLLRGLIPPFSLSAVAVLRRAVRDFAPDAVNVHYPMPMGLAAAIADRLWGVPVVLTLNGRDVPGPGVPFLWKYWHRLAIRCASEVTYVSEYCRDAVFGPDGPGVVTWNGVDFSKVRPDAPVGADLQASVRGRRILFALQRLSREKGVEILIRAMVGVKAVLPEALLLIGGTGPERESLETLAHRLGLSNHIRFLGFIPDDDLSGYFNFCEVFVFHSDYETFGIVLAQAMAHGKPVATVRNTAIPCVVADGGILAGHRNPEDLALAMLRILSDPALARRLGAQGYQRARTLFDWDVVTSKYEAVFRRVAAARPLPPSTGKGAAA